MVYLLPAVVAQVRRHHQTTAVIGLNPLLGWAFIGWAVAFAWAFTATPPTVPAAPEADPPWPDAARGWALILAEAATSCTTRWDAGLQRYLTRCSDGWQFKSTHDRGFQTWRTRELPPWKRLGKPKQYPIAPGGVSPRYAPVGIYRHHGV